MATANFFEETVEMDSMDALVSFLLDWVTGSSIIAKISSITMIFCGILPYIPQYAEIKRTGNADGFSLYVCLALLTANILRIVFWFGKHFETPLLIQSILMNIAMLLMIHLCVRVKAKSNIANKEECKTLIDFDRHNFWGWTDFRSYFECTFIFTLCCAILMYFFQDIVMFVESVGFIAVFVEACLGVPQFVKNYKSGSTCGMNFSMVLMWLCGDLFKTTYFVLRYAPIQFTICGCLQIGVDLAILGQVYWFYNVKNPKPSAVESLVLALGETYCIPADIISN